MDDARYYRIAKALADPTRHEILEVIGHKDELFCNEISACFSVAQPTISHHLRELANAGLVSDRREGQYIYYRLRRETLSEYVAELQRRMNNLPTPK